MITVSWIKMFFPGDPSPHSCPLWPSREDEWHETPPGACAHSPSLARFTHWLRLSGTCEHRSVPTEPSNLPIQILYDYKEWWWAVDVTCWHGFAWRVWHLRFNSSALQNKKWWLLWGCTVHRTLFCSQYCPTWLLAPCDKWVLKTSLVWMCPLNFYFLLT